MSGKLTLSGNEFRSEFKEPGALVETGENAIQISGTQPDDILFLCGLSEDDSYSEPNGKRWKVVSVTKSLKVNDIYIITLVDPAESCFISANTESGWRPL